MSKTKDKLVNITTSVPVRIVEWVVWRALRDQDKEAAVVRKALLRAEALDEDWANELERRENEV
jgi:SH3-like domain-containing protein